MKRLFAVILSITLMTGLSACADKTSGKDNAYVPSEDVAIAVCVVEDTAKVVTRRISDKALTGVELACVFFDAEGAQIGNYERVDCTFSSDEPLSIWTFATPADCAYVEAAVAEVLYADGTKNTNSGITAWVEQIAETFTVEAYQKKLDSLANEAGAAAQKCDVVEYSVATPENNSVKLSLKNIGDKQISQIISTLLWFDASGMPVDKGGLLVCNSEKVAAQELMVGEEAIYMVDAPEGAGSVKAVIQKVVFEDGTVWENDYIYEWSVVNSNIVK